MARVRVFRRVTVFGRDRVRVRVRVRVCVSFLTSSIMKLSKYGQTCATFTSDFYPNHIE